MNNELGYSPVKKLLVSYSVPAIIGSVINLLYTVVDRIFVGQKLGADALAGVTLTFPINQFSFAIAALIGIGASTLVSISLGQGRRDKVNKIVGNQLSLFFLLSVIIIIILEVFLVNILKLTGGNEDIIPYGLSYGRIIIPVMLFQCYSYGLNGVIRAFGYPKFIMITSSIGAISNILLDYIFLYPLDMGIEGVALATLLATTLSAVLNLSFFFRKSSPIKLSLSDYFIDLKISKDIFKFGLPSTVITIGNALVIGLYNKQLDRFGGGSAIAAYGVFMTMHSFILMLINGVSHGGMPPILGYNIGAKKYDRVLETIKLSLFFCLTISTIVLIAIELFPEYIMKIFVSDRDTIEIGVEALRYGFLAVPIMVATIVISNFYQALGEAKLTIIFNFVRKVIFIVPSIIFLPNFWELKGIWLSRPIADTLALAIIIVFFIKTINRFRTMADGSKKVEVTLESSVKNQEI